MKKKTWMTAIILILCSNVFADDQASVTQGAQQYDYQTCVNSKTDSCLNDCANSEDINCSDKCNALAKDKCLSEGIRPSQ